MAQYHPPKECLLDFVAGCLPEGFRFIIGLHVEQCPHCQQDLRQLQAIGSALIQELPAQDASEMACEQVWQRIQNQAPAIERQPSLQARLQNRMRDLKWQQLGPVRQAVVMQGEHFRVALLHIRAGAKTPKHTHRGSEMTMILSGAFSDCYGRYDQHDFMVMDQEHEHMPVASSDQDCVCIVCEHAPIRFTGPFMRVLNPFMRTFN